MTNERTEVHRLLKIGFERVGRWVLKNEGLDFEIDRFADKKNILYAFVSSGVVKYVGKSTKTLKNRMSQYRTPGSSQYTNDGNKKRILKDLRSGLNVEIFSLPDSGLIQFGDFHVNIAAALEDDIIRQLAPEWNGNPSAEAGIILDEDQIQPPPPNPNLENTIVAAAQFENVVINQLNTGTIEVLVDGHPVPAMPELLRIAAVLNIGILNGRGNPFNTRQLGAFVLRTLAARDQ